MDHNSHQLLKKRWKVESPVPWLSPFTGEDEDQTRNRDVFEQDLVRKPRWTLAPSVVAFNKCWETNPATILLAIFNLKVDFFDHVGSLHVCMNVMWLIFMFHLSQEMKSIFQQVVTWDLDDLRVGGIFRDSSSACLLMAILWLWPKLFKTWLQEDLRTANVKETKKRSKFADYS